MLEEAGKINSDALTAEDGKRKKYLVHVFPDGATGKALDAALKKINGISAVLGLSVDKSCGKIIVAAKVDKDAVSNGLNAVNWIGKVCDVIGGKGGGKEQQAQAVCEKIGLIDESISVANKFAELSLASTARE